MCIFLFGKTSNPEAKMMMETGERTSIENVMRTLWTIWGAMLVSLLIYVFICHQFGEKIKVPGNPDFPLELFKNILYGVAVLTLIIARFVRKIMMSSGFEGGQAALFSPASSTNRPSYIARYTSAVVISLALSESIGIYGLVLFILGRDINSLYLFIAVSAVAMFYFRPKTEELETMAVALHTGDGLPPEM